MYDSKVFFYSLYRFSRSFLEMKNEAGIKNPSEEGFSHSTHQQLSKQQAINPLDIFSRIFW